MDGRFACLFLIRSAPQLVLYNQVKYWRPFVSSTVLENHQRNVSKFIGTKNETFGMIFRHCVRALPGKCFVDTLGEV